jgi:hypothetical protein
MDGGGSSSDLRGGRAGVSARRGGARDGQRGCCRHREEGRATRGEGEQEVEAAHCTAAAGGRNCISGRTEQGSRRGSEEEDERGERSRTQV